MSWGSVNKLKLVFIVLVDLYCISVNELFCFVVPSSVKFLYLLLCLGLLIESYHGCFVLFCLRVEGTPALHTCDFLALFGLWGEQRPCVLHL